MNFNLKYLCPYLTDKRYFAHMALVIKCMTYLIKVERTHYDILINNFVKTTNHDRRVNTSPCCSIMQYTDAKPPFIP